MNSEKLSLHYHIKNTIGNREVLLFDSTKEVGHFSVSVNVKPDLIFLDLGIWLDNNYRKQGLSRQMMKYMVQHLIESGYKPDTLICIDIDASYNENNTSFWDKIGMKPNTYQTGHPTSGYEKIFCLKDLVKFLKIQDSFLTSNCFF